MIQNKLFYCHKIHNDISAPFYIFMPSLSVFENTYILSLNKLGAFVNINNIGYILWMTKNINSVITDKIWNMHYFS